MGSFQRSGTFQNRERFLDGVKQKLEKLMGGAVARGNAIRDVIGARESPNVAAEFIKILNLHLR